LKTSLRVLGLSPHTDDIELGCGATLAKHIRAGDKVKVVTFSSCGESLPKELRNPNQLAVEHEKSMAELGILDWEILEYPVRGFEYHSYQIRQNIYDLVRKTFKPDIIYTPWSGSLHQDHAMVSSCTEQVSRHSDVTILGYYVADDGVGFAPRYFEPLDEVLVSKKIDALTCYETQKRLRKWWNEDNFMATVVYWSPCTVHMFTEAFEVIKSVAK